MAVVVAGHLCVDLTPELEGSSPGLEPGILYSVGALRQSLGGSVANTGRALARLGETVRAHAYIGADELGDTCRTQLRQIPGMSIDLQPGGLGTAYSIVIEHGKHDRTFWQYTGANADFDPRALHLALDVDLLHVGYPSLLPQLCADGQALSLAFARAKDHGITTSLDLAHVADGSAAAQVDWNAWFAETIPYTDVWSPSWDDMSSALSLGHEASRPRMEKLAERMLGWGAAVVQLSAGPRGFILATASQERLEAAGRVLAHLAPTWADQRLWFDADFIDKPTTTVGAGDALTAGLLRAIRLGLNPEAAGQFARDCVGRHLRGGDISGPESRTT